MAEGASNNEPTVEQLKADLASRTEENAKLKKEYDGVFGDMTKYRNESAEGKQAMQTLMAFNEVLGNVKANPTVGNIAKLVGVDESSLIGKIKSEIPVEERATIDTETVLPLEDSAKIAQMIERAVSEKTKPLIDKLNAVNGKVEESQKGYVKDKNEAQLAQFNSFVNNVVQAKYSVYPENIQNLAKTALTVALRTLAPEQAIQSVEKDFNDLYGCNIATEAEKSKKKKVGVDGVTVEGGEPLFKEDTEYKSMKEALDAFDSIAPLIQKQTG